MHKISYDLPIGFYPWDFFFENINKLCLDFFGGQNMDFTWENINCRERKRSLHLRFSLVKSILTSKKIQTKLVYLFKEKIPAVTHNW